MKNNSRQCSFFLVKESMTEFVFTLETK